MKLVFITNAFGATVPEVKSGSIFATEVQKSFTKPTKLHGATPDEACFAASLHIEVSAKSFNV